MAVQFMHVLDFMIMMPMGSHLMRVFQIGPGQFTHLVAAYGFAAALTGSPVDSYWIGLTGSMRCSPSILVLD